MKLLEFAQSHGAELLPPVSSERICSFEEKHSLRLPAGLREFYLAAGGTKEFTKWDWRIWPFDELTTIECRAGENPDIECLQGHGICPVLTDYWAFIDVLIEAPLYAVCANPSNPNHGEIISLAGDRSPFLAGPIKTFSEFETILAAHWDDLILPDKIKSE